MTGMKKIPDEVSERVGSNQMNDENIPAPEPRRESEEVAGKSSIWPAVLKVLLVVFVVFVIVGLTAPKFVCSGRKPPQTEAINNARQIGLALYEFEAEYGEMPNERTIEAVQKNFTTDLKLGTKSSNDFFRQLIASGLIQSEQMFYAKISGSRKPDGVFTGASAIAKRECGFTYLAGGSMESNPSRPILVTPMIPGTDRFDPKPFDGSALIMRADNSVTSVTIRKDGRIFMDGKNLMDPSHPVWKGKPPMIAYPDL